MNGAKELQGHRFGRLVVKERAGSIGKRAAWLCLCDCGKESRVLGKYLLCGDTTSCGCQKYVGMHKANYVHGKAFDPVYHIYYKMLGRCENPKNKAYPRYGGRGIYVCERWKLDVMHFIADMGPRPEGFSVERKNNDGPYSPENCVWASDYDQRMNQCRSVTIGGVPLLYWADMMGLSYSRARYLSLAHRDNNIYFEMET